MQQYDPSTGRFRNTPSEPQSLEKLQTKHEKTSREIANLLSAKNDRLQMMISDSLRDTSAEENAWTFLAECDLKVAKLKTEISNLENLLSSNGMPGVETILEIAGQIASDTLNPIKCENSIVLNRLPRSLIVAKPKFPRQSIRHFFWTKEPEILHRYLEQSNLIGMMFECIDRPIVYNQTKERSQKE